MDRYKILYIWGIDSQLGKTKLAESIFEKPYIISDSMDLRGWNREHHDGFVIHDVPEVRQIILQYNCLFTGQQPVSMGTSATNCYAYEVDLVDLLELKLN